LLLTAIILAARKFTANPFAAARPFAERTAEPISGIEIATAIEMIETTTSSSGKVTPELRWLPAR
jgi:hypothetical protein